MNKQRNHQTVVAISMAVVVGLGAGAFALLHHSPAPRALVSAIPPDPIAAAPLATAPVAAAPVAAAPVAVVPPEPVAAPAKPMIAAVAHQTSVAPVLAAPKVPSVRRTVKAGMDTVDTYTAGRREAAVSEPIASLAPAPSVTPAPAIEQVAMAPPPASTPAADLQSAPALPAATANALAPVDSAAPDNSITAAVKSQLAADSASQGYEVGVTTTLGVVALTGTVATQAAIDHVRDIAAGVKDVKSVDTSGMKLTSG